MRGERGLTTSELLVSTAALVAVMGMSFAAFRGLGSVAESSSARLRGSVEARWLFLRLDSVLPALSSRARVKSGRVCFWGEETVCLWEALAPLSREPEIISLQFRPDEGMVVLNRGSKEEVLARRVGGFRLSYAGRGGKFVPKWGERGAGSDALPRFIMFRLKAGAREYVHVVGHGREE